MKEMISPLEPSRLVDGYGRVIRKLRVSLLDACNYRCFYCMPLKPQFRPLRDCLSADEIEQICGWLVGWGIEQIRLTGGEPTLRPDFVDITRRLSRMPLKKLGLTTNGYKLKKLIPELHGSKLDSINVSLDSLEESTFNAMTRVGGYQETMDGILAAIEYGFKVKINTVLIRGVNDHEIFDFLEFSVRHNVEVRFLELMKIGQAVDQQNSRFMSADAAIQTIKSRGVRLRAESVDFDSTAFVYSTAEGGRIGFIASESKPFCNSCSRLRLTSSGDLKACLMSDAGRSLRGLNESEAREAVLATMAMKPIARIESQAQDMYHIGG